MKVLMLTHSPAHLKNPYVRTLDEAMTLAHPDAVFTYGYRHFWTDRVFDFDIVHNMWPGVLLRKGHTVDDVEKRLHALHDRGVKVVSTCHNLVTHNSASPSDRLYDCMYANSDAIIHLGSYSYDLFCREYPHKRNVLMFHHVYDTFYTSTSPLGSGSTINVLCMGEFRNDAERELVRTVASDFADEKVRFICPSYYHSLLDYCKGKLKGNLPKNLVAGYGSISDTKAVDLCRHSQIMLIQRMNTLNSGNVSLGMLFGHVVVGPKCGNIKGFIESTGNISFNPSDRDSVGNALTSAINKIKTNDSSRGYDINDFSTAAAMEIVYDSYRSLLMLVK